MNPYKTYKTDSSLETNGVKASLGGMDIWIARAGGSNKRYLSVFEQKTRPLENAIRRKTLSAETSAEILREVYVESIVLGWENVENEKGEPIPYSKEACRKLLTDLPDLFLDIQRVAEDQSVYREAQLEEEAKNSASA